MRVLIFGLDGLEYNLVVKWRLKPLLQKRYGVYEAIKSPTYGKPHTPSAWTSFITGKIPEEHKVDGWWTYGRFLDWLRTKPPLVWIKNKRKILRRLGIKPRIYNKKDLRVKTIFDLTPKSIPLFIPGYNEPTEPHEKLNEAFQKGIDEFIKTVWEIHSWRKQAFFENLARDWDLFMVWFDIADLLGHICIVKCKLELMKAYMELASIVSTAVRKMPPNTLVLVVSDHGMEPMPDGTGDHSDYGFWSINKNYEWFNPRRTTDFYGLIKHTLSLKYT